MHIHRRISVAIATDMYMSNNCMYNAVYNEQLFTDELHQLLTAAYISRAICYFMPHGTKAGHDRKWHPYQRFFSLVRWQIGELSLSNTHMLK